MTRWVVREGRRHERRRVEDRCGWVEQRQPHRVGLGRRVAVGVGLADRRARAPELPVVLLLFQQPIAASAPARFSIANRRALSAMPKFWLAASVRKIRFQSAIAIQRGAGIDNSLIPIMDKVKVVANDEFEALFPKFQPSRVTITTNDGKEHWTRVDVPKGDPRDPMTEEEIAVKFTALGSDVIGKKQCEKLRQCIMNLEKAGKLDELLALTIAR